MKNRTSSKLPSNPYESYKYWVVWVKIRYPKRLKGIEPLLTYQGIFIELKCKLLLIPKAQTTMLETSKVRQRDLHPF